MTEKRFTWEYSHHDSTGEIIDWIRNECLMTDYLQKYELEEWCQELNKIVDENNQLRKENGQLKKENENLNNVLEDFMVMLNRLQANPDDKILQSMAKDMLRMMGKDILGDSDD